MVRYHARWVLPITRPPIENGTVAVRDGRIAYVGDRDGAPDGRDVDLGDCALLPGLVNAHTHLELTGMRGFLEDLPFHLWIDRLRRGRNEVLADDTMLDSARLGIQEGLLAGVTTYADTCSTGVAARAMREAGVRGIMFQEVFGPAPEQCGAALDALRERMDTLSPDATDLVRFGVSPHAPYTVSDDLYRAVAAYASRAGYPMAMHIAESRDERALVCEASGAFAAPLRARSIVVECRSRSPVELLHETGCLEGGPLLIHCITVDDRDIATMAAHQCSVAHCPTSNAKLGHGIAPVTEMLAEGIVVALGSDSVASNNRMSLLEEARLAALLQRARLEAPAALDAATALEMATLGGARALGVDTAVGSLEEGKDADFAAFPLDHPRSTPVTDIHATLIFAIAGSSATLVTVRGEELVRDGRLVRDHMGVRERVGAIGGALRSWLKGSR